MQEPEEVGMDDGVVGPSWVAQRLRRCEMVVPPPTPFYDRHRRSPGCLQNRCRPVCNHFEVCVRILRPACLEHEKGRYLVCVEKIMLESGKNVLREWSHLFQTQLSPDRYGGRLATESDRAFVPQPIVASLQRSVKLR